MPHNQNRSTILEFVRYLRVIQNYFYNEILKVNILSAEGKQTNKQSWMPSHTSAGTMNFSATSPLPLKSNLMHHWRLPINWTRNKVTCEGWPGKTELVCVCTCVCVCVCVYTYISISVYNISPTK